MAKLKINVDKLEQNVSDSLLNFKQIKESHSQASNEELAIEEQFAKLVRTGR